MADETKEEAIFLCDAHVAEAVELDPIVDIRDVASIDAEEAADEEAQYGAIVDASSGGSFGDIVGRLVQETFRRVMAGEFRGIDDVAVDVLADRQKTMVAQCARLLGIAVAATNLVDFIVPRALPRTPGFSSDLSGSLNRLSAAIESRRDALIDSVGIDRIAHMASTRFTFDDALRQRRVLRSFVYMILVGWWRVIQLWPEEHRDSVIRCIVSVPFTLLDLDADDPRRLLGRRFLSVTRRLAGFVRRSMPRFAEGIGTTPIDDAVLVINTLQALVPTQVAVALARLGRSAYVPVSRGDLSAVDAVGNVKSLMPLVHGILRGNESTAPIASLLMVMMQSGSSKSNGSEGKTVSALHDDASSDVYDDAWRASETDGAKEAIECSIM